MKDAQERVKRKRKPGFPIRKVFAMDLETISKLPEGKFTIGTREIKKAVEAGSVKRVIVASNCPDFLIKKFDEDIIIQRFEGDQKGLGTKVGKPFAIAMVGYE